MKTSITFYDREMAISAKGDIHVRSYANLKYIKCDKPHCLLYFTGEEELEVEITLKELIDNLPKAGFMKCNRSSILNICYLKDLIRHSRLIEMKDGTKFKLSKKVMSDIQPLLKSAPRLSPRCHDCYTCTDENCASQIVFCRRFENQPKKQSEKE